jgi:hypothetical protein
MEKLKKLKRDELVRLMTLAESSRITADEFLAAVTGSDNEQWFSIKREATDTLPASQSAWRSNRGEVIQLDDPRAARLKNKVVYAITHGDRHKYMENVDLPIGLNLTGVPLANRETDVDLGDYVPPVEAVQSSRRNEDPVKKTQPVNQPAQPKNDTYWDFGGGGSGVSLDDVSRIRKEM